jgi:hypothetical protein
LRRAARALPTGGSLAVLHGFVDLDSHEDPFEKLKALQFTLSSGEEEFQYAEFLALLSAEGFNAPQTSEGWQLAAER